MKTQTICLLVATVSCFNLGESRAQIKLAQITQSEEIEGSNSRKRNGRKARGMKQKKVEVCDDCDDCDDCAGRCEFAGCFTKYLEAGTQRAKNALELGDLQCANNQRIIDCICDLEEENTCDCDCGW